MRKNSRREYKYGITQDQYNKMFIEQNGLCKICKKPETFINYTSKKIQLLSVDHDHQTGKVRGLLCNSCNNGLGHFKDNPQILLNAANYLDNGSLSL